MSLDSDLVIARLTRIITDLDVQRHRLVELLMDLEAERAIAAGTFAQRDHGDEAPTQIAHDIPPSAPR